MRGASLKRLNEKMAIKLIFFSVFAGCFSDTLEMRPMFLNSDMQSVVDFSVIPKCMTSNDIDWLFRVKFCFRAGLAD